MVMLRAMRCRPAGSGLRPRLFWFWFIFDVFCYVSYGEFKQVYLLREARCLPVLLGLEPAEVRLLECG